MVKPFRGAVGEFSRCGGGHAVADEDGGFFAADEVGGVGEDDGEDDGRVQGGEVDGEGMHIVISCLEEYGLGGEDCFGADGDLLGREEGRCGDGGCFDEGDARDGSGEVEFLRIPDFGGGLLDGGETFH